jgi:hypothetical protein
MPGETVENVSRSASREGSEWRRRAHAILAGSVFVFEGDRTGEGKKLRGSP